MPLQNRVTPFSELVAHPARGLLYGNRGCLHDGHGRIRRRSGTRRWIACQLEFKDWQRGPKLQPGKFTELFFLDEVTAFAAGHRPCALCRRRDAEFFARLFSGKKERASAGAMDRTLHAERLNGKAKRTHRRNIDGLPDGAMVALDEDVFAIRGSRLLCWTP